MKTLEEKAQKFIDDDWKSPTEVLPLSELMANFTRQEINSALQEAAERAKAYSIYKTDKTGKIETIIKVDKQSITNTPLD